MRTVEVDEEFVTRFTISRKTRESQCYLIWGIAFYRGVCWYRISINTIRFRS